jgi:hypothetical protein
MKQLLLSLLIITALAGPALFVSAQTDPKAPGTTDPKTAPSTVELTNPLGKGTTVPSLIGRVINAALGIVGSLALLMFVYGGFTWMLSGGNSSAVEKGKNILIWATLGLVIIFVSYALVNFIINTAT